MCFQHVQSNHGLYIPLREDVRLLVPVFVNDISLACSEAKVDSVVQELSQHFKLRDLGPTTELLGMQIHRDCLNCHLSISQAQCISNLLQAHTPATLNLTCELPDVSDHDHKAIHHLCCWSPCQIHLNPGLAHCQAAKYVPCYLKSSINYKCETCYQFERVLSCDTFPSVVVVMGVLTY